jgi:hypothetical protein
VPPRPPRERDSCAAPAVSPRPAGPEETQRHAQRDDRDQGAGFHRSPPNHATGRSLSAEG